MKKMALAALLATAFASPSLALTDAQCEAEWVKLDADKDGKITEAEGARYHAALRVGNVTPADGTLAQAAFVNHCKAGLFNVRAIDDGAPLKGANSFTETQAKDRAVAHGLTNVAALQKDADGIWRGTAKRGEQSVSVAVDFKGNVVAK